MAPLEILQNIRQLGGRRFRSERQHAINDMVRARLVGGVEIARFGRRSERAHDHSRRVGTQIKGLPVQERGFWHGCPRMFAALPLLVDGFVSAQ